MSTNANKANAQDRESREDEFSPEDLESVAGGLLLPAVQKARDIHGGSHSAEGTPLYLKLTGA